MEEHLIIQVVGQVMKYDPAAKHWNPAGPSSGLSTVRLIQLPNNTFRIHGQKIGEEKEVVLDSQITREVKYNRANEAFIQWHDSQAFWGLNFRRGSTDAESFFSSIVQVLRVLNQNANQQQPPPMVQDMINNAQQQQQQQQQQQSHIMQQQAPQQTMLHQQQSHMMGQAPAQVPILGQGPTTNQMLQQHQQQQQQQMLQHHIQHYVQPPQTQSQPSNQNQMNHYQHYHLHQQPAPPSQQHLQQTVQQHQAAPVVAAPIPPPPPPPPAPPALNNLRLNGSGNSAPNIVAPAAMPNGVGNSLQHSPITTTAPNSINCGGETNNINRNGGSPNQAVSLASELAKCQLRKVNLSRSDSDNESECNNNTANAKTTRAASLAYVPDNLMNDLNKKLASRRERIDQQGDGHSALSSAGNNKNGTGNAPNTNGINGNKNQESWLSDLIRREISKEITKMKAEIIDAIKTELRSR